MPPSLHRDEYTAGWVCALPIELAAAQEMLDDEHDAPPCDAHDTNIYTCGRIGQHNIVIACLPEGQIGTNSAAAVAMQMRSAFTSIRFGLMVGIGGGVPSEEADVRLGDVVVSKPHKVHGGVVQYDSGKATTSGFERTGSLNTPPTVLLNAVTNLRAKHIRGRSKLPDHLSKFDNLPEFTRESAGPDTLFEAKYNHIGGATCKKCSGEFAVSRAKRSKGVVVHHGTIASGNRVMKDAAERDSVSMALGGVLCFEMEAAGLMNNFPCVVIRGVCDYADSHKNKRWQSYAAGTAAAYAKELLSVIPVADVLSSRRANEAMQSGKKRKLPSPSPGRHSPNLRKIKSTSSEVPETIELLSPINLNFEYKPDQVSTSDAQKQELLKSLSFKQIYARQRTIKTAHSNTCKWFLESSQYLAWLDETSMREHHGFLWIKGKAGTGKSTLMKSALVDARQTMKDCTVLSFFFNARGEEMEKSTIGLYRSLLLQLLQRFTALQSLFYPLNLPMSGSYTGHEWDEDSLQVLIERVISSLGEDSDSVLCFIDALDECEEEQIREMIQFFEHVGDLAVSNNIRFRVCVSSRHYPHITVRRGLELVLEGQDGHTQDIIDYIETELKIGTDETAQRLRIEVQRKASGIFMWAVLVVRILNKESDRGQTHILRQKLMEIPGDLYALFHNILTRGPDTNKDQLVLCIQWVLFSVQPLTVEQLYYAILSGTKPNAVSKRCTTMQANVMLRFILDCSKGLTEVTVAREPTVQFIHESVKDFLVHDNGLSKIWPEIGNNFKGQSHEQLKQCCLNYIGNNFDEALINFDMFLSKNREAALQSGQFMEYAYNNMLYHADAAEGSGISQADFLSKIHHLQWITPKTFLGRNWRKFTERVSLSYVLAVLNMSQLPKLNVSVTSCIELEHERCSCPLFAAMAIGRLEAAQAIVEKLDTTQSMQESTIAKAERSRPFSPRIFANVRGRGRLSFAAELGLAGVIAHLIQSGTPDIDLRDPEGRSPLWWASCRGQLRAVQLLLSSGKLNIDNRDNNNQTPMYAAVQNGHSKVVRLLLDAGADVNAPQTENHNNAIHVASYKGYKEIVKMLLDRGANVNAEGRYYGTALQAASCSGQKETVKMLLDQGADVNAQGGWFGTAIQAALCKDHKDVVAMLLEKGATRSLT